MDFMLESDKTLDNYIETAKNIADKTGHFALLGLLIELKARRRAHPVFNPHYPPADYQPQEFVRIPVR